MAVRRKKISLGGRRPGAGRKGFLQDAERLSVSLDAADAELLREIANERGVKVAEVVRAAVRAYLKRLRR